MLRLCSLAVLVAAVVGGAAVNAGESASDDIFGWLQTARARAGKTSLERRARLDAVALDRAELIAALPHRDRLAVDESIGDALRASGILRFRNATVHMNMNRGYDDPAAALFESWQEYKQGWRTALGSDLDGIGLATVRADDGWVILTAVLVDDLVLPDDFEQLERDTIERVNKVRRRNGRPELVGLDGLDTVARTHSRDMADRAYLAHRSPEGHEASDRVRASGQSFRNLAENIYMGRGLVDPAASAVDGWMNSKGHRANILDARFTHTGLGVAIDEEGTIYFTQVFLTPRSAE